MSNIETRVVKPDLKFTESEQEFLMLTKEVEELLDNKIQELENFLKNEGKGQEDEVKDTLYKDAQELWREYALLLKDVNYNFYLNRKQYKYLNDLLANKMEYDVNTIFFAIELTEMLNKMRATNFKNDNEFISFPVDATEITYIYHLISKHKLKGLSKDSYTFTEVLVKIGAISKVFNYYDASGKNLATEITDWVSAFEDGVTIEGARLEPTGATDDTLEEVKP